MPQIQVGDLNVGYEVKGSGHPLLMIMGLTFSLLDWGDELPNELAKHYQVILFDNRDAGRTTSRAAKDSYTISDMADDAAGLLQALGVIQSHVFGVSMGGMIAQQFALKHTARLNKLVLGCTMAGGACSIPANLASLVGGSLLDFLFTPSYLANSDDKKKAQEFLVRTSPFHSKEDGFVQQMKAIAAHDTCNLLQDIKAPTLVITGDGDVAVPSGNSDVMQRKIPNSKLKIIKDAGHGFPFSHAFETAGLVDGFLQ